jgi:hypothetical protein
VAQKKIIMARPGQRNKLLLERMPIWLTCLLFLGFMVFIGVFVGVTHQAGIEVYHFKSFDTPYSDSDFDSVLSGRTNIEILMDDLVPFNTEILFHLRLFPQEQISRITGFADDILLEIKTYVTLPNDPNTFVLLNEGGNYQHLKHVVCPETDDNEEPYCNAIAAFHVPFLQFSKYKVLVKFLNQQDQSKRKLFQPLIQWGFTYMDPSYAWFEIILRYTYLAITIIVILAYVIVNRIRQQFLYWHEEQYWILALLMGLIFFNNPLFIFNFIGSHDIFPLINIAARVSFLILLLLWLLVFTHSMYVQKSERKFLSFYMPKILLTFCLWVVCMISFIFTAYKSIQDPAFQFQENKYFSYIQVAAISFVVSYLLMLGYYILRMLGLYDMLPSKYTIKFKIVWGMTILIIVVSAITFIGLKVLGLLTSAIIFFSFQLIFNLYIYLLALLFLASNEPDTVRDLSDVPLVDSDDY